MIVDNIKETVKLEWRNLPWLQVEGLKEYFPGAKEKIKESIRGNGFVDPFKIWKDKEGTVWILDGCHRQEALKELEKEGEEIPDILSATYIECESRKQAAKLVLIYSAKYAGVTEDGLADYLREFEIRIEDIEEEMVLPELRLGDIAEAINDSIDSGGDGCFNYKEQYGVIVICDSEEHQRKVYDELKEKGYDRLKVVTT